MELSIPAPDSEAEFRDRKGLIKRAYFGIRFGKATAEDLEEGLKAGGEELAAVLAIEDPEARDAAFRRLLKELNERIQTPLGVWRMAVRREIVGSGFDYSELFWDWVRARREDFAAYLRTDGRFVRKLKEGRS